MGVERQLPRPPAARSDRVESLPLRLSDRTSVNFDLEAQRTEGTADIGIPIVGGEIPDVPRTRNYGSPFDTSEQETGRLQINLESVLGPRLTLRNKTYYTDQDWTSEGAILGGVIPLPGSALLLRLFGALHQETRVLGDQFDAILRLDSGSVQHELVAGIEAQELLVKANFDIGLLPPIDLLNPVETAQKPIVFLPGAGIAIDLQVRTLAPYVLDVMHFAGKWHLSLGGRLDAIDQQDDSSGLSEEETELSPFAGLLYTPTDRLSLYANYGEGFNPISLGVVSADPKPEKSRGAEIGIKTQALDGRLRTSAALYQLKKNNIAIVDQTGVVAQLGDQESKGAEVEVSASLRPGLDALLVYGYTDATLTRFTRLDPLTGTILDFSGNAPTWAPKHVLNTWLGQRFPNGIGVAGGIRHVGSRFVDEANLVSASSYTTLDATVSFERPRWSTVLYLNNLTDADYETRAFDAVIPASGFNVKLAFRVMM
ncbi:MAG TPA: TonB-dependent receptor [Thermoanaerobaculia bacterium]|nr:TonB-dependent receptor [Thermoanaerobaculia bacterium]